MNTTLNPSERVSFALRSLYQRYGYRQYKVNKFEEYDLYARYRSFLTSEQILSFSDLNGRLMALKPDVTLSIIKNTRDDRRTRKLWYTENVYRVPRNAYGFQEIVQTGLEFIGHVDLYAMAEVLMLAAESLRTIRPDYVLELSHIGILTGVLGSLDGRLAKELIAAVGEKNLHTLKLLEETHKSTISEMLKELTHTQDENISFRQQLEDQIAQYETTKEELENENESLKEKIAKLQKEEVISKYIDKSKRFKDTAIVDRFMLIAESPLMMPEDDEWEELVNTTSDYYPELIRDMNKLHGISVQEIRLCILVAMSIRESDVARMMGVSNQRVTNIKSALNKKMFGDSSARSLYKNLSHRYDIFSQLAEA